ncbi:MAG: SDR family oxidoreductase, partial [Actinobacteria bacterium]|nr:SDR family oxidoreductase [Actinomycetota bacterium]
MILLIGATGFLGPVVLEKLLEKGYSVRCMIRRDSNKDNLIQVSQRLGMKEKLSFSIGTLQS